MAKKGFFRQLLANVQNVVSQLTNTIREALEPTKAKSIKVEQPKVEPLSPNFDDFYNPVSSSSDFPDISDLPDFPDIPDFYNPKLDVIKSQYEDLISEANQRWEMIEAQGYQSMAINRAREETERDYFTLEFASTEQEVIEEVTRARVFIADKTSTIEGAELYTSEINSERFKGKFGKQYRTPEYNNKGFDTNVIDEEYAKEVFRSYRNLESIKQGLIQEYGSENLIIAMYDAQVRGEDPLMVGLHLIETWYRMKTDEWNERFEEAQNKYSESRSYSHGTVFDYVKGRDIYDNDDDDMFI